MNDHDYTFEDLYKKYGPVVFNLSLQYLHNMEDAEEITQDVFVQVFYSISDFKKQSSFKTWIYRITINKCCDFLKAKKSIKRWAFITSLFNQEGNLKYDSPNFNHPGIILENKQRSAILFKAIAALSDKQKTAFILSQIENLSQQEIAGTMSLSQKAIESLIQRAKENLRKKLGNMYHDRRI